MFVHPLVFEPILKSRIWGGRRLETRLGKKLPVGPIGESWEVADLEDDQSVVAGGPQKGRTLAEMVDRWGEDLLGRARLIDGRFPLLLKFLDAQSPLSVQVHPSPDAAARLGGRVRTKDEAWYVIDADPDGWMLRGLNEGVDEAALTRALQEGDIESVLRRVPIRPGHAYYLPSGTIHALGPGALIAEVQTPSDITYRLFDWNRADPSSGAPRELHLDQALESIRYEPVPEAAEHPEHLASVWTTVTRLIRCESFVVERVRMVAGVEQAIPYDEMVIWMVLSGGGSITCKGLPDPTPFGVGDTVILPARLKDGRVKVGDASAWLEISVPVESSLAGFPRPDRTLASPGTPHFVPLDLPPRKGALPSE